MKYWLLGALAGVFVLATAPAVSIDALAQGPGGNTSTPWSIGDVFVAVGHADLDNYSEGGGVYRVLNPQGLLKNEPDLIDFSMDEATGCAVDVATGDLFTTSFWGMVVSRFDGAGAAHPLEGSVIDVANLPMNLPVGKSAPPLPLVLDPNFTKPVFKVAIESVVFDRAGDMFVGAQELVGDAFSWVGHAWILKISKAGVLLDWWQVDAGDEQNPLRDPGISTDVHGVDWLDLSADESTIYYTSEDTYIRSFQIAPRPGAVGEPVPFPLAGIQRPAVPIHHVNSGPLGGKAFALRILPPGDPANGFLVATPSAVYRVKQNGEIIRGYYQLGVEGYFTLNLTPDGQSFWTASFGSYGPDDTPIPAEIFKFHIGSGAMSGPFSSGRNWASGICVKREYTAAQNVCIVTNLNGDAVPDASDPSGYRTKQCTVPPLPSACNVSSPDPDCLPPGTPTLTLADQRNRNGQYVDVTLQATDPWGEGITTWTVTGLPPGMDANGVDQALAVTQTGPDTAHITGFIRWGADQSSYMVQVIVTNTHGQSTTGRFPWVITNANAPPTLTYATVTKETIDPVTHLPVTVTYFGGPRTVLVGNPIADPVVMFGHDLDGDSLVITATYERYLDAGFLTSANEGVQPGLPAGMTFQLPGYPNGEATASIAPNNWAVPLGGQPEVTGTTFPRFFRITVQACDCNTVWNTPPVDPAVAASHRPTASFDITVTNTKPTFSVADQLTVVGTNVTYTQPYVLSATDTLGDTLTYGTPTISYTGVGGWVTWLTPLPSTNPALLAFSAAPALINSGSVATITVTVTDAFGAATTTSFKWTAITNRPPVCSVASPSKALWPPNHKFVDVTVKGVTDPDNGDTVTIKIDSIWQDESVTVKGSGKTDPDGKGIGTSVASVRAERAGGGDGRVYQINFTASDGKTGGTCSGSIYVGVPHDQGGSSTPIDSGIRYNSVTGVRIH